LLKRYYISKKQAKECIEKIWKTEGIVGNDPAETIKCLCFLDIQKKGNSQKAMLKQVDRSLQTNFGLHLADCGRAPSGYVYLDDCPFSGNTVVHDLKPLIPALNKGRSLHIVTLASHSGADRYIDKALGPLLQERNIKYQLWSIHRLNNLPWEPESHQLLWPCEVAGDAFVDQYIASVRSASEGQHFTPRFFRPSSRCNEDVFASPEARQVVESAYLRKGAYIIAQCQNPQHSMRPLGYEYLSSLGFGAIVVTYRNIANNCPLALWWGDPDAHPSHPFSKWFPLIPRKGN
jgi:hypothetical protein